MSTKSNEIPMVHKVFRTYGYSSIGIQDQLLYEHTEDGIDKFFRDFPELKGKVEISFSEAAIPYIIIDRVQKITGVSVQCNMPNSLE